MYLCACACVCVFNSLSLFEFSFVVRFDDLGEISSLGFKAFLFGPPSLQHQGTIHSTFIFNDISLATGTISGCWLRFDSMFHVFYLRDTFTRFLQCCNINIFVVFSHI